jgi:hypothetical protein
MSGLLTVRRPKQTCIFLYCLVCFAACVTLACLEDGEAIHGIPYNLSRLYFGGILSTLTASTVIISYLARKSFRRHPNPLIFWRSVADVVLALRYIVAVRYGGVTISSGGLDTGATNDGHCRVLATWTEAGFIASEAWFFMLTFDMYKSLTNPFSNYKTLMRGYHCFVWSAAAIFAVGLNLSGGWGINRQCFCWIEWDNKTLIESVCLAETMSAAIEARAAATSLENIQFLNKYNWAFWYSIILLIYVFGE